jgi:hypothetical protein
VLVPWLVENVGRWLLLSRALKGAAALSAGLLVLGLVVERAGPWDVEAVVHVTEPDVEVSVGGQTFRVEGWAPAPLVCRLAPGTYELVMSRGGRELYRESFTAWGGENLVLTARDPSREPSHRRR